MSKHNIIEYDFDGVIIGLTAQEKTFCEAYVKHKFNGMKAAIEAGYSAATAISQASRLQTRANVKQYIGILKNNLSLQIGIDAADIARELAKIGFADIRKIFDADGNLISIKDLQDESVANIASIEIFEEYQGFGEDRKYIGQTKKVKFNDKVKALDQLAKMIGADTPNKKATPKDGEDEIDLVVKIVR